MHVKFTADYDHKPTMQSTIAYKAGWSGTVTRACGDAAIAAGKAERVNAPRKGEKEAKLDAVNSRVDRLLA